MRLSARRPPRADHRGGILRTGCVRRRDLDQGFARLASRADGLPPRLAHAVRLFETERVTSRARAGGDSWCAMPWCVQGGWHGSGGRRSGHGASLNDAEGRPARRSPRNRSATWGWPPRRRARWPTELAVGLGAPSARYPGAGGDVVKIMTIHASKGLEVPRRSVGRLRRRAREAAKLLVEAMRCHRARLVSARSVVGGVSPAGRSARARLRPATTAGWCRSAGRSPSRRRGGWARVRSRRFVVHARRPTAPARAPMRPTRSWPKRVLQTRGPHACQPEALVVAMDAKAPSAGKPPAYARSSTISAARCAATAIFTGALPSFPYSGTAPAPSSASSMQPPDPRAEGYRACARTAAVLHCPSWTTLRGRRSSREAWRATMRSRTRRSPRPASSSGGRGRAFRRGRGQGDGSGAAPSIRAAQLAVRDGRGSGATLLRALRRTLYRPRTARGWPMPASAGSPARRLPQNNCGGAAARRVAVLRADIRCVRGREIDLLCTDDARALRALVRSWWTTRPAVRTARPEALRSSTSCRRNATPMHCWQGCVEVEPALRARRARGFGRGACKP